MGESWGYERKSEKQRRMMIKNGGRNREVDESRETRAKGRSGRIQEGEARR